MPSNAVAPDALEALRGAIAHPENFQITPLAHLGLGYIDGLHIQIRQLNAKLARFPSSIGALNEAVNLLEQFVPASVSQTDAVIAVTDVISWMRSAGEYPRKLNPDDTERFPDYISAAYRGSPTGSAAGETDGQR